MEQARINDAIAKKLIANAVNSTYYVATGGAMRTDIAKEHGITEKQAEQLLNAMAVKIDDYLRQFRF